MTDLTDYKPLPLEGFGHYLVSTDGRIVNSRTGRQLKTPKNNVGYFQCCLHGTDKRVFVSQVAKLVALTWIPNDDPENKKEVDHIDLDKTNNNVENLRWCTRKDNLSGKCEENRMKSMKKYWNDPIWLESWKQKMKEGREKRYERMRNLERC